ncbi:MAG: indolepyruvate ferredoxin oxidoreductase family protein [Polyangiales bacterium]
MKVVPTTRISLSGVEAIGRLLVLRHELDRDAGLEVAAMVAGYPGSPLGGVDLMLEQQSKLMAEHHVLHRPGVNEELALATAWGSQMGANVKYDRVDGVVAAWYGKTPGLDRSGDVLRHASALGSGPNGGFVLFCGDDPSAKSSTLPCDSQYTFQDACVPVFYPGDQQEVVELGVHAFALSRWAGPLVGMKIVTAVADGTGTVELDRARYRFERELEPALVDGQPWRHEPLWTIGPHRIPEQERLMVDNRLAAARAYVRQHGLDRVSGAPAGARLGIVTAGKTYYDLMQTFADLGLSREELSRLGVRVLKLAMTYPLVEETTIEFARSVDELVVVEEKRPFIESQLRAILHEAGVATRVLGKRNREGKPFISTVGELDATQIANVLTTLLPELQPRKPKRARPLALALQLPARPPAYCSGCPHNRSTVAPAGALVGGGIGCHGMVYFEPRQSELQKLPPPPMGAEGVAWIGLAPFVTEKHLIQNLGDGTLSHSGILAIRASVAAGVNVTYKILYNGVVAMTGGQDVAGLLDIPALTRALEAEGVSKVVVCADHPDHYPSDARWSSGIEVHSRDLLEETQQRLRDVKGVSVLIYDQRCASEARSLRKRGLLETPPARVVINEAVCEGCGDCVRKSNCTSVMPHRTEFGDKRRVDDLTCNRDYTCVDGECPSFVTLVPKDSSKKKAARKAAIPLPQGTLPEPARAEMKGSFGVYFTGIGGTGVVTAGRILTTAAEAAGLCVSAMDQTGLSQKAGAVVSHIHFAVDRDSLGSANIGPGGADLYLSGDILQAASPLHLAKTRPGRTVASIEREITPTSAMQQAGQRAPELAPMQQAVREQLGQNRVAFVESQRIAEKVFSESVLANVILIGAAFQLGGLPLSLAELEAGLQGRGSNLNREAFEWGRWAVHAPEKVEAALAAIGGDHPTMVAFEPSSRARQQAASLLAAQTLPSELVARVQRRAAQVVDYQSAALARRFLQLIQQASLRDSAELGWRLTLAVVESWFKLLTYKDEYEVARLHAAANYEGVARRLGIEGDYELKYQLHPPFLARLGMKKKLPLGKLYAFTFAILRRMKWLRGTIFDVFRWDPDRKLERALIEEYDQLTAELLADASLRYETKVEIAASALDIRGYRTVKERNVALWRERVAELRRGGPANLSQAAE